MVNAQRLIFPILFLSELFAVENITLQEYFKLLTDNHPGIQQDNLNVEVQQKDVEVQQGLQDWRITSSPYYTRQHPLPPGTFTPETMDIAGVDVSLSRQFWSTGGRFSMSWNTEYTRQGGLQPFSMVLPEINKNLEIVGTNEISLDTGSQKYYQSRLSLNYNQPLLQNIRGTLDRLGLLTSQKASEISEIQAIEMQEEFLLKMGLKFLNWTLLSEKKQIAEERKALADRQLEQIQQKRNANLVDEIDVLRSEVAVGSAEQGVLLINAQTMGLQAELAAVAQSSDLMQQTPDFDLFKILPARTMEQTLDKINQQSRLVAILEKQIEIVQTQRSASKELTQPELNFITQLSLINGDETYSDAITPEELDYGVSLQFSYPLGNQSAKSRLEKNDLEIHVLELAEQDLKLTLESSLRNLLIQYYEFEKVLENNRRQIITSKLSTEEELKRYDQGRGDLTFVIQSQDNEALARLTYAQNAATYQSINMQIQAILDELVP